MLLRLSGLGRAGFLGLHLDDYKGVLASFLMMFDHLKALMSLMRSI